MPNTPVRAAAEGMPTEAEILEAYRQWLHFEGRLCGLELYPDLGDDAGRFIPEGTFAADFHFPLNVDWKEVPQPSTRARTVLTAVGLLSDGKPVMTPRERLDFHAREFARAARDIDPLAIECWVGDGVGDNPQRYMVIVSHKVVQS